MTNDEAIREFMELRRLAQDGSRLADALDRALDALNEVNASAVTVVGKPVFKFRVIREADYGNATRKRGRVQEWNRLVTCGDDLVRSVRCGAMVEIQERVGYKSDGCRLGDVVFLTRNDAEKRLKDLLEGINDD